jgi:hypothetical protein
VNNLAIIEPLGMRFFGIEMRETELYAISNALKETFNEYPSPWYEPFDTLGKISDIIMKFGDIVMEEEQRVLDSSPEALRELMSKAGVEKYKGFLKTFLEKMSRKKTLVKMLSSLSSVSIGMGSISVRFRNRKGIVEELKINLKKMWEKVKDHTKEIRNSFQHFSELVVREANKTIIHLGVYAASFVLVVFSLWFSIAYNIASGLSTIASTVVNTLKASFPILSFIVWLFCLLVTMIEGKSKAEEAYEIIKKFLAE